MFVRYNLAFIYVANSLGKSLVQFENQASNVCKA